MREVLGVRALVGVEEDEVERTVERGQHVDRPPDADIDEHGQPRPVEVGEGDVVTPADSLVILESMKMEIPVHPEEGGRVVQVAVGPGDVVQEGALIAVLEPA